MCAVAQFLRVVGSLEGYSIMLPVLMGSHLSCHLILPLNTFLKHAFQQLLEFYLLYLYASINNAPNIGHLGWFSFGDTINL